MKKKIIVYQEQIHSYRYPIWLNLSNQLDLILFTKDKEFKFLSAEQKKEFKLKIKIKNLGFLFYKLIFYSFLKKSDYFWLSIDTKNLFLYFVLILNKFFNKKNLVHSQGFYDSDKYTFFIHKLKFFLHFVWLILADKMFLYSSLKRGPYKYNFFKNKIKVVVNRDACLEEYLKSFPINFIEKSNSYQYLLILGRVKNDMFTNFLVKLALDLQKKSFPLKIKLIGDASEENKIKLLDSGIEYYGAIREPKRIYDLAKDCSIGFYPTDAGLSITTYQMLGLIPVFHSSISKHNGPEPFEVYKNSKCFLFERDNLKDAVNSLISAYSYSRSKKFIKRIGNFSRDAYHEELMSKF